MGPFRLCKLLPPTTIRASKSDGLEQLHSGERGLNETSFNLDTGVPPLNLPRRPATNLTFNSLEIDQMICMRHQVCQERPRGTRVKLTWFNQNFEFSTERGSYLYAMGITR